MEPWSFFVDRFTICCFLVSSVSFCLLYWSLCMLKTYHITHIRGLISLFFVICYHSFFMFTYFIGVRSITCIKHVSSVGLISVLCCATFSAQRPSCFSVVNPKIKVHWTLFAAPIYKSKCAIWAVSHVHSCNISRSCNHWSGCAFQTLLLTGPVRPLKVDLYMFSWPVVGIHKQLLLWCGPKVTAWQSYKCFHLVVSFSFVLKG